MSSSSLTLKQGQDALNAFESNYHTGIDLVNHEPRAVAITDESLMEFGGMLELTSSEVSQMKRVAERVLADAVQPLSNASAIRKIVLAECHLCNCGRNDSGFDMVLLFKPEANLHETASIVRDNVHAMTAQAAGRSSQEIRTTVERHEGKTPMAEILHFEYDSVHVNIAFGHQFADTEEANRVSVWNKIDTLDKENKLKKVHLDQFSIDLYESSTEFMNNQVTAEHAGGEVGSEKFIQGALRLARAWRQSCLSSRDIQFGPFDAWLVMLNAVHAEVSKIPPAPAGQPKTASAVSGIKKKLGEMFRGVTGQTHVPEGVSMTNVLRSFLRELSNIEQMNITFADMYDSGRIPDWIKTQRPLVLDPVCPYRNTVYNLHKQVNQDIKNHANECLRMLDNPHATLTQLFQLPSYKKRGA